VLGFELGEQLIQIMDVPGAFDLGQHDDVELVAGGCHDFGHVVQHPWRVQAIDARPHTGCAEVVVAQHLDEALARVLLLIERHGIFKVAEDDIDLPGEVFDLGADLVVVRGHEVDHAFKLHRKSPEGFRRADGEGGEMLGGRAGWGHVSDSP